MAVATRRLSDLVWAVFWVIIAAMVPLLLFAITAPPMLRFLWL